MATSIGLIHNQQFTSTHVFSVGKKDDGFSCYLINFCSLLGLLCFPMQTFFIDDEQLIDRWLYFCEINDLLSSQNMTYPFTNNSLCVCCVLTHRCISVWPSATAPSCRTRTRCCPSSCDVRARSGGSLHFCYATPPLSWRGREPGHI